MAFVWIILGFILGVASVFLAVWFAVNKASSEEEKIQSKV